MMVEVFTAVFQDEALVVKSLLESAGLSPEMLADGMLDVNPLFTVDIKGLRVCVPDGEAEDAAAIVADYRARKAAQGGNDGN
jgi:hypothetical protein